MCQSLYKRIHAKHHRTGASCTTLATSYGEVADVGLCFAAFHLILAAWLASLPAWNLPSVALLATIEVSVNNLGHTGYDVSASGPHPRLDCMMLVLTRPQPLLPWSC